MMNAHALMVDEPALNSEERRTFDEDGVICLRGLLPPRRVAALRSVVDDICNAIGETSTGYDLHAMGVAHEQGEAAIDVGDASQYEIERLKELQERNPVRVLRDDVASAGSKEADKQGSFFIQAGCWKLHPAIRFLARNSILPAIAGELLDSEKINHYDDQIFVKTAGGTTRTAFHHDLPYFKIAGSMGCIAWVALDRVNEDNGRLEYIRGSHKWGQRYAPNIFFAQNPFPDCVLPQLPDIEGNIEDYDVLHFDVEPGDVIFHHMLTVHGSGGNKSMNRNRRALSFRYCGDDIVFHDHPDATFVPHQDYELIEGAPIDCDEFPVVWRRGA